MLNGELTGLEVNEFTGFMESEVTELKSKKSSFHDLLVWQKSKNLAVEIYNISKTFPKEDLYGITSQIRRCSLSIPSNIAEGSGRKSSKEFTRFLHISLGVFSRVKNPINYR